MPQQSNPILFFIKGNIVEKVEISRVELENHLKEQIGFLEASSSAFDQGMMSEAKRIAVAVRVLVHDTRNSQSLLSQLGEKCIPFLDTAKDIDPDNLVTSHPLMVLAFNRGEVLYKARLGEGNYKSETDFETWWSKPVLKDNQARIMTRRDLILNMADKDGGAHVDPKIGSTYNDLKKNNSMGWVVSTPGGKIPLESAECVSVRQIGYEILHSIRNEINYLS